ncbi:MAG: rod shape-determining protein MreC [Actinobacteria bacterium]|nr:rod shape-determining protein MreC [Actinomycetota bacterium]
MRYGGDNRSRLLLVILIVTSLFLITLDLRGVKVVSSLRNGSVNAMAPFQRVASDIFSPVGNFFSDIAHLGRTRSQIKDLEEQNDLLRSALIENKSVLAEIKQLKSILDLSGKAGYKVVNAKVISQGSSATYSQTIMIDVGKNRKITRNMTVICGQGLVGVVKEVFASSALVMLESDPAFRVGARIAGSNEIGIISGQGTDKAILQLLDSQSTVKVGNILLARGSEAGKPFVPGVPIGTVTSVLISSDSVSQLAEVRYFTDLHSLGVVAVVIKGANSDPRDILVPRAPKPTPTVTVFVTPSPIATPTPTKSSK